MEKSYIDCRSLAPQPHITFDGPLPIVLPMHAVHDRDRLAVTPDPACSNPVSIGKQFVDISWLTHHDAHVPPIGRGPVASARVARLDEYVDHGGSRAAAARSSRRCRQTAGP